MAREGTRLDQATGGGLPLDHRSFKDGMKYQCHLSSELKIAWDKEIIIPL
jgi:hypothetical protein